MKEVLQIPITAIQTNKNQPRVYFDEDALADLALSIKHNGLLQPIVVRKVDDGFELVAGERRFRACKLISYTEIPAIVMEYDEMQSAEMALIENIQRQDLSAIEEAQAYVNLIRTSNLTQEDVAKKVGKSQASVANKIRLLQLPSVVQNAVSSGSITERHARALLSVDDKQKKAILKKILKKGWNVKQCEAYVESVKNPQQKKEKMKFIGLTKNMKIAMNTVHQAVAMINRAGVDVSVEEIDDVNDIKMIIRISKR